MKRLVSLVSALALAGTMSAVAAPSADAHTLSKRRVTLATSYGKVVVEGRRINGSHGKVKWTMGSKGNRTPLHMQAVFVKPVGQGGCLGDLWLRRPGPDKNLGPNGGVVHSRYVTVEVKRHRGCR